MFPQTVDLIVNTTPPWDPIYREIQRTAQILYTDYNERPWLGLFQLDHSMKNTRTIQIDILLPSRVP